MCGTSISGQDVDIESVLLEDIKNIKLESAEKIKSSFLNAEQRLTHFGPEFKTFCIMLIDGLSGVEEIITEIVGNELGGIPLIGASSGDGLNFIKTSIFYDGKIHENAAVLLFVTTSSGCFSETKYQNYLSARLFFRPSQLVPNLFFLVSLFFLLTLRFHYFGPNITPVNV